VIPVAELLRRLEVSRSRVLAEIEGVDEARFTRAPKPGVWAVGQVLEHIARIDDAVAAGTRRVIDGPPGPPVRWHDHLMQLPYRMDILDGVRVRTARSLDPETAPPQVAGLARFAASREALRAVLAAQPDADLSRWTLPHPIFGRMRLDDMCALVAWHEERHRKQIVRILKSGV
jgi:uncharacterized damage-inducible protein DinB